MRNITSIYDFLRSKAFIIIVVGYILLIVAYYISKKIVESLPDE